MKNPVVRSANILLPAANVAPEKWAVVAVDQYTSQPEYWDAVESIVGDAPSTLRLTLPEVSLKEGDARIPAMQRCMRDYLANGTLTEAVTDGYLLVERSTESGARLGMMACLDLEQYDFAAGSQSLIRATEGTVIERVPPRVKIRRGAALELPHVLMLADDVNCRLIEPLYGLRASLEVAYDFTLMQGGGHLRGWKVAGDAARQVEEALDELYEGCGGLMLAVGDGNHSLATAKACWEELKPTLSPAEREDHPARYALVEVVNLYDDALTFAPIHRVLTGADPEELRPLLREASDGSSACATLVTPQGEESFPGLPVHVLQPLLDDYLAAHPAASIDYVHGDEAARTLGGRPDSCALLLTTLDKLSLFPAVARGPLPRKAFSMGQANEKRCYFECRAL